MRYRIHREKPRFAGVTTLPSFPLELAGSGPTGRTEWPCLPTMFLLVCETYRTSEDDLPHQTGIWREVSRRNLSDPKGRLALPADQSVPQKDLALDVQLYGDYAE